MKLPKPITRILIAATVLVTLGVGAWCWVTWPERTAMQFVREFKKAKSRKHRLLGATETKLRGFDFMSTTELDH